MFHWQACSNYYFSFVQISLNYLFLRIRCLDMVSVNIALELRILLLLILSDAYLMPLVRFCGCKDITKSALNEKLSKCERFPHSVCYCIFLSHTKQTSYIKAKQKKVKLKTYQCILMISSGDLGKCP